MPFSAEIGNFALTTKKVAKMVPLHLPAVTQNLTERYEVKLVALEYGPKLYAALPDML